MQESITMAAVGSIVNVSGSRIATPLGPPRPGSTPTKMPSVSPTIMRARIFQVSNTLKPIMRSPTASIPFLVAEQPLERPLGHDHVEGDLEGDEHGHRKHERRHDRHPGLQAPHPDHESRDEDEARDVEPEPFRGRHEEERR